MMAFSRAITLLLTPALLASATSLDSNEMQQSSCSNGMFEKHGPSYAQSADASQPVWAGIYGGDDGFFFQRTVITVANATSTFPHYTNLLDVVQAGIESTIQESSTTANLFRIRIPAQEQGAIYFTPTLLCFDGTLRCGGKDENGTYCAPFVPGVVNSGNIGFVSQGGANAGTHAKSTGHRVGPAPGTLQQSSDENDTKDNHASPRNSAFATTLLVCSMALLVLWA